jgi:acyl carrier protein
VNENDIRVMVTGLLRRIAPEIPVDSVDPDGDLQDEFDLDSIDFLNLVEGIHDRTGIDVPEHDYPQLGSLDGCVRYLAGRRAGPRAAPPEREVSR